MTTHVWAPDYTCAMCGGKFYEEQMYSHDSTGDKVCEGCVESHQAMETLCAILEGFQPNLKYRNIQDGELYQR